MPDPAPPSPCVNVCTLDADGYCIGCCRTIDEIARWVRYSPAEKCSLVRRLAERVALRGDKNPVIQSGGRS